MVAFAWNHFVTRAVDEVSMIPNVNNHLYQQQPLYDVLLTATEESSKHEKQFIKHDERKNKYRVLP